MSIIGKYMSVCDDHNKCFAYVTTFRKPNNNMPVFVIKMGHFEDFSIELGNS